MKTVSVETEPKDFLFHLVMFVSISRENITTTS